MWRGATPKVRSPLEWRLRRDFGAITDSFK